MSYTKTLIHTNYLNLSVIFPHWLRRRFRILDLFFYTIYAGLCICLLTMTITADAAVETKRKWSKPRVRVIELLIILIFLCSCTEYVDWNQEIKIDTVWRDTSKNRLKTVPEKHNFSLNNNL